MRYSYLLSVMEACSVLLILELCWFHIVLQSPKVVFSKLLLLVGLEALIKRWLLSLIVFGVDGGASSLREWLSEQVLRLDLGHVAGVTWNMLSLQVLGWTTEPVITSLWIVTVSNGSTLCVSRGWLRVVLASSVWWFSYGDIDIVVAWLLPCSHDNTVNISSCASIHLILLGCVACVPWQVLLAVVDLCHTCSQWLLQNNQL